MSKPYYIQIPVLERINDHFSFKIELLSILSEGEMKQLFEENLQKNGWEKSFKGWKKSKSPKEYAEIDMDTLTLTNFVEIEGEVLLTMLPEVAKSEISLRAQDELLRKFPLKEMKDLQQKELDGIIYEVYREALQIKAKKMGDIVEVSEKKNQNQYEIKIKIRV